MSTKWEATMRAWASLQESDGTPWSEGYDAARRYVASLLPQAAQHQHAWVSSPVQPGVPREICYCGAIRAGSCVPQAAKPVRVLTDAKIEALAEEHLRCSCDCYGDAWQEGEIEFARAVLAAAQEPNP